MSFVLISSCNLLLEIFKNSEASPTVRICATCLIGYISTLILGIGAELPHSGQNFALAGIFAPHWQDILFISF